MSIDVEIVRPKRTGVESLGMSIGVVLGYAWSAWFVMLLTPVAISWHPGFWQSFAAVIVARTLTGSGQGEYGFWTKSRRR